MSPEEIVENLLHERIAAIQRQHDIKEELVKVLLDQKMTEFFSVDWSKLNRVFLGKHSGRRK